MRTFEDVARAMLADAVTSAYIYQHSKESLPAAASASLTKAQASIRVVTHMLGLDDRREEFRKASDLMWEVIRNRVVTLPEVGWLTGDAKERDAARWAIACEALRQVTAKMKGLNLEATVMKEAA